MRDSQSNEVTRLLAAANVGDPDAMSQLAGIVYEELRALAGRILDGQPHQQTLRTTALVNEAYVKLVDRTNMHWDGRSHFFGVAARAMRSILVDHARHRHAVKRGGKAQRVPLDDALDVMESQQINLIELDEALTRLTDLDERKGRVVELRFFGGLSTDDTAQVLDISPATVERDWRLAKAWLQREMTDAE